jgi:hypothetical protein
MLTFRGSTDIDGGVTYLRQDALPILTAQHGYRGVTASGNRSTNVFGILSLWETEEDRASSDSALGKAREEAVKTVGGNLTVENLEQMVGGGGEAHHGRVLAVRHAGKHGPVKGG